MEPAFIYYTAYILKTRKQTKKIKLYVNGVIYSVEELKKPRDDVFDIETEYILPQKNHSAPATLTLRKDYLEEWEGTANYKQTIDKPKEPEAKRPTDTGQRT